MQLLKGPSTNTSVYTLSPLERAIDAFEKKATDYYRNAHSIIENENDEERLKREQDLKKAFDHLNHERRHISILAQLQIRLQEYQAKGKTMSTSEMLLEAHHPTGPLATHMRAAGRPKPSNRHSAHHLVQGKGRTPQNAEMRLLMHMYGIRINDPDNGVWLPKAKKDKGHWSMPHAPAHSEIHTRNYETWVSATVSRAKTEIIFRSKLLQIRTLLRDGRQPAKVTAKPDASWRGI